MNEQIVIVTLFACGLTLIVAPWVEKKLDDYLFKVTKSDIVIDDYGIKLKMGLDPVK